MSTLRSTIRTQAPPLPESPYRGIESFRYIDQEVFSAREDETWDLLSNILIYRGVLLYGDSGSGKSSLINAGLIPAALKENLIANRLRIQPRRGKEIKIERIPTESDDKPPYLTSVFIEEGSSNDEALSIEISLPEFYAHLEKLKGAEAGGPRPLLIFDQFEEFITLFEEALRGGETQEAKLAQKEAPEVQQAVLNTLTKLMEDETLPVKVLFVFREDYLAKLNLLFAACPDLSDQYVRLLPPRVEEAEKIIRAPFVKKELKNRFNSEMPDKGSKEIPEQLAKAIATQLQERSENGFINLSELQIVCSKLWESSDPVHLFEEKNGDIQKILEDHWADVLAKLGKLYDAAIALLSHMVTSSNTRNIVSESDLKNDEKDNFGSKQIDDALEALVERKLVRREPRHKIYFYEIASEFLVPWIQQKKAARLAKIEARKLAAEREKRNLWIGVSTLSLLLVVAIGLVIYSFHLNRVARKAQGAATDSATELSNEKKWSENIVNSLNDLAIGVDPQVRLDAVNRLVALNKDRQLPSGLVQVILAVTSNEDSEEVSKAASYFLTLLVEGAKTDPSISIPKSVEKNATLADTNKLPPRVYVQIASNDQRQRADKIANALRSIGFVVPSYELVDSGRTVATNQLRYSKSPEGADSSRLPDPNTILQTIKNADGTEWYLAPLRSSSSALPGHFEIWFADPEKLNGTLVLSPFDAEAGEELNPEGLTVTLTPVGGGASIMKHSAKILAKPGKYKLSAQYPNYVERSAYQNESLIIEIVAGKPTSIRLLFDGIVR